MKKDNDAIHTINMVPMASKKTETDKNCWRIDRKMLRFKVHFFFLIGAIATADPFCALIAKDEIGISATSFGAIVIFRQFFSLVTKLLIAYTTDYFNNLKRVVFALILIEGIAFTCILCIPSIPKEIPTQNNNDTLLYISVNRDNMNDSFNYLKTRQTTFILNEKVMLFNTDLIHILFFKHKDNRVVVHTSQQEDYNVYKDHKFFNRNVFNTNYSVCILLCEQECQLSSDPFSRDYFGNQFLNCSLNSKDLNYILKKLPSNYDDIYHTINTMGESNHTEENKNDTLIIKNNENDLLRAEFWIFGILYIAFGVCSNALQTLTDTACLESIEETDAEFGMQRLWGALGWGSMAALAGVLNEYTAGYWAGYGLFIALSAVALWNIWYMNLGKPHVPKAILKNVWETMRSREFIYFEIGVFINGIALGVPWFYLLWFVTSIGGNLALSGLVEAVQTMFGIVPFMFISDWLLRKTGEFNMITISLLAYCVRFFWYSQLKNPWYVLITEWMYGINFGLFYNAMASFAKMSSKPGTEATTQAVIFATFDSLGTGIGNIIAGICFDYYGGHRTFFYFGIFSVCCLPISMLFTLLRKTRVRTLKLQSV